MSYVAIVGAQDKHSNPDFWHNKHSVRYCALPTFEVGAVAIIIALCNLATPEPISLAPGPLGIYYVYKDVLKQ